MKILTKGNYVDFEAPIHMDEEQFNDFYNFMSELLEGNVERKDILEKHKVMKDIERKFKDWDVNELFLLLSPMSNEELEEKLQRSNMSIVMKRGSFVPAFMSGQEKKDMIHQKLQKL